MTVLATRGTGAAPNHTSESQIQQVREGFQQEERTLDAILKGWEQKVGRDQMWLRTGTAVVASVA